MERHIQMLVKDLIEELKKHSPEAHVFCKNMGNLNVDELERVGAYAAEQVLLKYGYYEDEDEGFVDEETLNEIESGISSMRWNLDNLEGELRKIRAKNK